MKVCVSDRLKHQSIKTAKKAPASSHRPHCFIVKLRRRNTEMVLKINSYFILCLVSGVFCFPPFLSLSLCVFVCAAKGPTRLCGHHCKSTLTRC